METFSRPTPASFCGDLSTQPSSHLGPHQVEEENQVQQALHRECELVLRRRLPEKTSVEAAGRTGNSDQAVLSGWIPLPGFSGVEADDRRALILVVGPIAFVGAARSPLKNVCPRRVIIF